MEGDAGILHELWEAVEDEGITFTFCFAGPRGDGARKTLPANARLIWTVWAGSHFEAMTRYYERQEWGVYTTGQAWDFEPYPAEWVQEQCQYLAGS
jgi:hypothetical protein